MAELAFEDHRFWDIRRWKIGEETTKIKRVSISKAGDKYSFEYSVTADRIWDDKMYFYPIPQSEIYKNSQTCSESRLEIVVFEEAFSME